MLACVQPPRLVSVSLVRRYPNEDTRRKQFEFEDEFKSLISGTAQPLGPANAPPDHPRFMITDGKRTLLVSNVTAQLNLDFGGALPKQADLAKVLDRPASVMDQAARTIFPHQKTAYSAIVILWAASKTKDLASISAELAPKVFKATLPDITSMSATVGLEKGDFTRTIELSQYRRFDRLARVTTIFPQAIFVDADFDTPDDEGLQIKLDVNTKPTSMKPTADAFARLIPVVVQSIKTDLVHLIDPPFVATLPQ